MWTTTFALLLTVACSEPKTLLEELTKSGLEIPGGERFRLSTPSMAEGLDKKQQLAVLEKYAEEYPRGLFVERNQNAPVLLKVKPIENEAGKTRGHTVDLWFVAYGKIEQLDKQNMLGSLLGAQSKGKGANFLSDEELSERKITPIKTKQLEERYLLLDTVLVDKIQLTGVLRNQKRNLADGSLVSVMLLDDRFAKDKKYPNQWSHVENGKPNPYAGFGGYVKATPIPDLKDGIFIEMHFAFAEPYDWFEGRNILASKLPLAVRNNVRTLRQKLGK